MDRVKLKKIVTKLDYCISNLIKVGDNSEYLYLLDEHIKKGGSRMYSFNLPKHIEDVFTEYLYAYKDVADIKKQEDNLLLSMNYLGKLFYIYDSVKIE